MVVGTVIRLVCRVAGGFTDIQVGEQDCRKFGGLVGKQKCSRAGWLTGNLTGKAAVL